MSVELFGFKINNLNFKEGIDEATALITKDKVSQIVTINPEMIEFAEKHTDFANIIHNADMVIPDGVGVKIALKINGYNVQRLPGVDFAYKLLEVAATNKFPVAIIGAKEEIITKAIENLKQKIDGINIVYYHNGYFNKNDDTQIYKELLEKEPKLILVAMGSPRQEEFIYNAKNIMKPSLMIGIGGSLDVWSGVVRRAPKIYQNLGLEWLYRVVTQPERFKRIFPTLPLFIIKAIGYRFHRR